MKAIFPRLSFHIWIIVAGRFISFLGTGFTLFYSPIYFTERVGLTATLVGVGIGAGSISGAFGRIISGGLTDSANWGRRRTILMAAFLSAVASFMLAYSFDFGMFTFSNLIKGLGIGLFWPASEALVADLSQGEERYEAYAMTRLADNLGLGVGVILGGLLIKLTDAFRTLFIIDAITYLGFFAIIFLFIRETVHLQQDDKRKVRGWPAVLTDSRMLVFLAVNVMMTIYLSQVSSVIPIFFRRYAGVNDGVNGFSFVIISSIFTWYVLFSALTQLPAASVLKKIRHTTSLIISALFWGLGLAMIWGVNHVGSGNIWLAIAGLGVISLASVTYAPSASAFVAEIAPAHLRGTYSSANSLCWAAGYFLGPAIGGYAMDRPDLAGGLYWLILIVSTLIAAAIFTVLGRIIKNHRLGND